MPRGMTPSTLDTNVPAPRYFEAKDEDREKLRAGVEAVALLVGVGDTALQTTWASLVKLMAMEAAHELRACPSCNQTSMALATRCGSCWEKLTPATKAA